MGSPTRHGVDWGRVGPSPTTPKELDVSKPGGGRGGPFQPPPPSQVIPVSVIDAFFQELPELSIQPIIKLMEAQFTFTDLTTVASAITSGVNLPAIPVSFDFFSVPPQYVYIIVDVLYYALAPSKWPYSPLVQLSAEQLAGLVRFDLTFSGRQPARFDMSTIAPHANPGSTATLSTGWPLLETLFGPQRTTGFAVYARSSQDVKVTVTFSDVPHFVITKIGAHLHGYAVPEGAFEDIFMRRRLGR